MKTQPEEISRTPQPHLDPEVLARMPWQVYEPPRPGLKVVGPHMAELWKHRHVLAVLILRELKARYRGSVLGFAWSLLNPLALLAVYSLVFSIYLRIAIDHYPLYLLAGLLPWLWLSQSLTSGANSLIQGKALVTRVMLPPQVPPIVEILSNGTNFLLGLPVLLILSLALGRLSFENLLLLPLLFAAQGVLLVGLSLPLAAACVVFRDVKFLVQNLVTFWFFLTPIVYPTDLIPETLRLLLYLNPFFYISEGYHSIFYEGGMPLGLSLSASVLVGAVLWVIGILGFERLREKMVEHL